MNERMYWKLLRIKKGIRIKQIAEYLGCSLSYVARYEKGVVDMIDQKVKGYRRYIKEYQPSEK
ncbi:helix-turn-helix transcriptional regulator [Aneurinibacillus thermoaerophilus]|uniref:helix-turn-helix domain-containing protein n=1 Tax=Aneurinibacillus thermoaerophilus TaxID=143495 RepID=UPI002E21F796|nr:helix-turn-helix transcriptional regulator [Aneurinibacillus thermoaerophilus]MED0766326.1 helix-turn-helix transcriptional regulator [Aneurinibacillus thermoaerophilus]